MGHFQQITKSIKYILVAFVWFVHTNSIYIGNECSNLEYNTVNGRLYTYSVCTQGKTSSENFMSANLLSTFFIADIQLAHTL